MMYSKRHVPDIDHGADQWIQLQTRLGRARLILLSEPLVCPLGHLGFNSPIIAQRHGLS
jgi:hypothetical protein